MADKMKALELAEARRAELETKRSAAVDELEAIADAAIAEERSFSDEETATLEARRAEVSDIDAELDEVDERVAELERIAERSAAIAARPSLQVISKPDPNETIQDRDASPTQLADALTRAVEDKVEDPENMDHVRKLAKRHSGDREWARSLVTRASDDYTFGWGKLVTGQEWRLTSEERAALSTLTDANGNYLVPTHLDPTVILTNDGSSNAIRGISRVVTLTRPGDTSWQGVTSAGVTATWGAELAEVTDNSPTFTQPSIATEDARAFVQASFQAIEDIPNLASEILAMFADAKDRLEGAAHATGAGSSDVPTGIFTAIDAVSGSEVEVETAEALSKTDLDAVYRDLPVRHRGNARWLMSPRFLHLIHSLGTAVSASFSGNLSDGPSGRLLGKSVVESDDAPSTYQTTTVDNILIFGDFSNYVIVDKPGSMAVEFIPHLFNTNANLPDGRRGWWAHWRTGADTVNADAFRLLQDATSA